MPNAVSGLKAWVNVTGLFCFLTKNGGTDFANATEAVAKPMLLYEEAL